MKLLNKTAVLLGLGLGLVAAPATAATLYMASYPDKIVLFDNKRQSIVGDITLETGLPTNMQLSDDGKLAYVSTITTNGIEVIDTATHRVINSFSLNRGNTKYRFNGGTPDPTGRYFYTMSTKIQKGLDRYTVSRQQFTVVDLQEKKVIREVELTPEQERNSSGRGAMKVSPDGKLLYIFGKEITVLDTKTLGVVDTIKLELPEGTGLESGGLGGALRTINIDGKYTALLNAEDSFIHSKVFGIGRFDLNTRQFDFQQIGVAPETMAGMQVTPDGKTAYTVVTQNKLGNKRCEFWRFNLATNQVTGKSEFECRSRFQFGLSEDGKKLYIYGASFDIEVYDGQTFRHEKTWDLAYDTTGAGMVIVP